MAGGAFRPILRDLSNAVSCFGLMQAIKMVAAACAGLLIGCVAGPPAKFEPTPVPIAWAQQPTETDLLSVGRVVSVEGVSHAFPRPAESPGTHVPGEATASLSDAVKIAAVAVIVSATTVALLPVAATAALTGEPVTDPGPPQNEHGVFRHTVRLKGTNQEVVKDEYWRFEVGDCVAIRTTPAMLVPALPGICD